MFFNTQNSISAANKKALTLSMAAGLLLMTISPATMAQQRISGGGNVIVCEQPNKAPRTVLLDYYDSIRKGGYGFKIDLGPGQTNEEKIKYVLDRLEKVDPFRANLYRKYAAEFENDMVISDKKSWGTPSSDLGNGYFLEEGCSVRRLAILRSDQEVMLSEDKKRYSISGFWEDMDETTKAGIKLHEIAYREALARGAEDSLNVRRYVALISSKEVLTADYAFEIAKSGLIFWGELVKDLKKFRYSQIGLPLYDLNFPPATHWSVYNDHSFELNSSNNKKRIYIYLNQVKYQCSFIQIRLKHNYTVLALEKIYLTLTSEKGLLTEGLPEDVEIQVAGCGNIRVNSDQLPYLAKRLGKSFDFVLNTNVVVTSYSNWIDSVARVIDNRLGFIFSRDAISGWIKQGFLEGESANFLNKKICHINYGQDGYKCYSQQNGYTYSEKEYNTLSED